MHPHFSFKTDEKSKMKSILYNNIKSSKPVIQEIDINIAYNTIAHDIIEKDSDYPVFTCSDSIK